MHYACKMKSLPIYPIELWCMVGIWVFLFMVVVYEHK